MNKILILIITVLVFFSSCNIDKRLYRRGFLISCSDRFENPKIDQGRNLSNFADYKLNQINEFETMDSLSVDYEKKTLMVYEINDEISRIDSGSQKYAKPQFQKSDFIDFATHYKASCQGKKWTNDTINVHPLLIAGSILSMGLSGLFIGTLIYKVARGFAFPYFFPAANLFAVIFALIGILLFIVGNKIVSNNPDKWKSSKLCKLSFAILIGLSILYVFYVLFLLFFSLFSLL